MITESVAEHELLSEMESIVDSGTKLNLSYLINDIFIIWDI